MATVVSDPTRPAAAAPGSGLLHASALTKRFGSVVALERVSLQVGAGEVVGLLGPNGAGKTTLLRCAVGHLRPTSGTLRVLDGGPGDPSVRSAVGYLPADPHLEPRLRVSALLDLYTRLRGVEERARVAPLCERLHLDVRRLAGDLSTGNRRKVALVLALAHRPRLLLLDEPTSGLDPGARSEVEALVREAAERGAGVVYSSHDLAEVAELASRVVALDGGTAVGELTGDGLAGWGRQRIAVRLADPAPPAMLDGVPGVVAWSADGRDVVAQVQGPVAALLRVLASHDVQSLQVTDTGLARLLEGQRRPVHAAASAPRSSA